jgi:sugar lactone lactonase YvrE
MLSLWLAPANAAPPPRQHYFVVDAYQMPGTVFRIQNREPSVFFRRQSGGISSIALWRGQLFFCSGNDRRIYLKMGQLERIVFEHNEYVRDIAVDKNGYLYFSEASGARSDGRIYRLTPHVNNLGSQSFSLQSTQPFYTVRLNTVDGFWSGDFTFDARDNLYQSSGNRIPAYLYRVSNQGGQYGSPQRLYRDTKGAIKGIAIDPRNPNFAYYADWKQTIYGLSISSLRRNVIFSQNIARTRSPHLSDVAFDITAQ